MDNIVAIIPARGGSQGIIKKNIRIIDKYPLIYYQIKAALKSKYLSKVYISTDDEEIANTAKKYEGVEIINRPEEISTGHSKTEEALIHAVNYLENKGQRIDIIVLLQATSPLNKSEYIDKCIEKVMSGFDSVCCAVEDFGFFIDDKELLDRPMRQNRIPRIRECGNCWAFTKETLLKFNNRLGGEIGYVLIDKWDALEVDDPEDLTVAKSLLEIRNRQEADDYFIRRSPGEDTDFEESYWGETIDPDGQIRNRILEKDTFIEDTKDIINYINSLTPGKILDVGCGFGFLLSAVNDKWEKCATEISEYSSKVACNYATVFTGELLDTCYAPLTFDVITLYHVIEHLNDPIAYIKKVNDLLKVGGKLIVGTPDFGSIVAKRYKDKFRLLHDKTHISLFSTESLVNLLKDNGFEIEHIDYPYFETRYFNKENLLRLLDCNNVSPPFFGNIVNIYAYKC